MTPAPLSPALVQATDTVLRQAFQVLEGAGVDFHMQTHQTVIAQGGHLQELSQAMTQWMTVSCMPHACTTWLEPHAHAAQQLFQAVEEMFDLPREVFNVDARARVPISLNGENVLNFLAAQQAWNDARPQNRRDCRP